MALTQAQRDAIKANLNLDTLDTYASNPDSLIEQMTPEQLLEGLKCGTLSLEQLNYLFFLGFTATEKALAESKAYTDGKTTELANKLNFCNALSPRSGNLLQADVQPDGSCKFYYGIEPPADLVNQYVDPVNGQDSNIGSRASPLRTIIEAVDRLPTGTNGSIHLIDNAVHYWTSSNRRYIDKVIRFYPYGAATDAAQAAWDAAISGWYWLGWQNSPRATIKFQYDELRGPAEPGKYLGVCINVNNGMSVYFNGINFVTPNQASDITAVDCWKAAITGNGKVICIDCKANLQELPLFSSSPQYSPFISLDIIDITGSANVTTQGSGGKINIEAYQRTAGTTNPQGLLYNNGSAPSYIGSKAEFRATPAPISNNYFSNF